MLCPTCEIEFDPTHSAAIPFCSDRCRQIDLGRWLDERNVLPVMREPGEEDFEADYEEEPPES